MKPAPGAAPTHALSSRIAAGVEGAVVTAATITVAAESRWDRPVAVAGQVLAAVVVFWLGHAFAHGLGSRATASEESGRTIREDLTETWLMVVAALPQLLPFMLAGAGVFSTDVAYWASYVVALLTVALCGWTVVRNRPGGALEHVRFIGVIVCLGAVIVFLKELIH